jgi:hypothetical protein
MTARARSRMGANVATAVDDWIPPTRTQLPGNAVEQRATVEMPPKPAKVRATFQLPQDLLERARDAVVALASTEQLTLAELVEQAIDHELERLRREHNRGEVFPHRRRPLRPGRPIAS